MPKTFKIPENKLEIDYNLPREVGHILTKEEIDYVDIYPASDLIKEEGFSEKINTLLQKECEKCKYYLSIRVFQHISLSARKCFCNFAH